MNILKQIDNNFAWHKNLPTDMEKKAFIEDLEIKAGFIGKEPVVDSELIKFIALLYNELIDWKRVAGYKAIQDVIDDAEYRTVQQHIAAQRRSADHHLDEHLTVRSRLSEILGLHSDEENEAQKAKCWYSSTLEEKFDAVESKIKESRDEGFLAGLKYAKSSGELASDRCYGGFAANNVLRKMNEVETKLGLPLTEKMTEYQKLRQENMVEVLSGPETNNLTSFASVLISNPSKVTDQFDVNFLRGRFKDREYPISIGIAIGKKLNPKNFSGYLNSELDFEFNVKIIKVADAIIEAVMRDHVR